MLTVEWFERRCSNCLNPNTNPVVCSTCRLPYCGDCIASYVTGRLRTEYNYWPCVECADPPC